MIIRKRHFEIYLNIYRVSIEFDTINQVILAFWLVLAYDLLEDRHTIDVIATKFFPSAF